MGEISVNSIDSNRKYNDNIILKDDSYPELINELGMSNLAFTLILSNFINICKDFQDFKFKFYNLVDKLPREGKNFSKIMPTYYPMMGKIKTITDFLKKF